MPKLYRQIIKCHELYTAHVFPDQHFPRHNGRHNIPLLAPDSQMNSSDSTDARDYWVAMERKVELGAKILYVLAFLLFNLVYWVRYLV